MTLAVTDDISQVQTSAHIETFGREANHASKIAKRRSFLTTSEITEVPRGMKFMEVHGNKVSTNGRRRRVS